MGFGSPNDSPSIHCQLVGQVDDVDVAEKIVMLGGTPRLDPDLSTPPSDPAEMLRNDIAEEQIDVGHYLKLAEPAESSGLVDLKFKMEEQAADEAGHAEEMTRLLR